MIDDAKALGAIAATASTVGGSIPITITSTAPGLMGVLGLATLSAPTVDLTYLLVRYDQGVYRRYRCDQGLAYANNPSVHEAVILWNGEEREVRIIATGRRPLLGTALLDEHELVVQFTQGGLVTIDAL